MSSKKFMQVLDDPIFSDLANIAKAKGLQRGANRSGVPELLRAVVIPQWKEAHDNAEALTSEKIRVMLMHNKNARRDYARGYKAGQKRERERK